MMYIAQGSCKYIFCNWISSLLFTCFFQLGGRGVEENSMVTLVIRARVWFMQGVGTVKNLGMRCLCEL